MADDDFADFESAYSRKEDEKDPQSIPNFSAFEIPPLDFDDDEFSNIPSSVKPGPATTLSGDLFNLPPPLPSLGSLPSETLPLDFHPLPSLEDLPVVGVASHLNSEDATSANQFLADFSSFTGATAIVTTCTGDVTTATTSANNELGDSFGSFGEGPKNEDKSGGGGRGGEVEFDEFTSFADTGISGTTSTSTGLTGSSTGLTGITGQGHTGDDDFANFSSFSDNSIPQPITSTSVASIEEQVPLDNIGILPPPPPPPPPGDDDDEFANFSSFSDAAVVPQPPPAPVVSDGDDFDEFTSFSDNTVPQVSMGTVTSSAPPLPPPDDDFGEFGSFDTVPVPPPAAAPIPAPAPAINKKAPKEALAACFPGESLAKGVTNNINIKTVKEYLSSDKDSDRVWSQLNDKAESARFFFQWNSSFLKDRFYTAVKVDPMLIPAVSNKATGLIGDIGPLMPERGGDVGGGVSFVQESPAGATLLDLSLPLSPSASEEVTGVSFDDFIGLSLNASDQPVQHDQEQSKEATPTMWMDSELLELESETQPATTTTTTTNYDWLSRLAQTTPTVPPSKEEDEGEAEQQQELVETKSSFYELLASEGSTDNMGWSFSTTTAADKKEESTVSEPVMRTIMTESHNNQTQSLSNEAPPLIPSKGAIDTTPLDTISSLFENPLSFPTNASSNPPTQSTLPIGGEEVSANSLAVANGDTSQRTLALIKKLPQLDFMLAEKLIF